MDQVPKNIKTKAGRWKKLLTILPLITLAGVGSALSSGVLPPAEHHDDALSKSAKVATFGSSIPVRSDDATSGSLHTVELDGPTMCLALNIYVSGAQYLLGGAKSKYCRPACRGAGDNEPVLRSALSE
jgi:hypothetical protein